MNDTMAAQLARHIVRRTAMTLPDGTRPLCWWKRYQTPRSIPQVSDADIAREAARAARQQETTDADAT